MEKPVIVKTILAVVLCWTVLFPCSDCCDADEYRLPVFTSDSIISEDSFWEDSWIGSGDGCEIEQIQNRINITETADGVKSLMFSGSNSGDKGWWVACIARPMWQPFYLEDCKNEALLEFSINYEEHEGDCFIGIADKSRLRREAILELKNYILPRKGWQKVEIPLLDFYKANPRVDFSGISHVILKSSSAGKTFRILLSNMLFRAADLAETEYPVIKINQCGYRLKDTKIAKVSGIGIRDFDSGKFFIIEKETGERVFEGKIRKRSDMDTGSGDIVFNADFSEFGVPGCYRMVIRGNKISSAIFRINDDVYNKLLVDSLRMFYLQRCGTSVNSTGWRHGSCHTEDATLLSEQSKKIDAAGGWHDAGDYGKYIVNAGVSVGTLLYAYELFPEKFSDGQMNIPESSNGVPDILDEARWEIDWFFKMQREDGGVYHKLAGIFQPKDFSPDMDKQPRYIIDLSAKAPCSGEILDGSAVSTAATANFAAVCSLSSRIFEKHDAKFSRKCLVSAEKAWDFLAEHPEDYPPRGFCNPQIKDPFIISGEYGDDPEGKWTQGDKDERFWASVELFLSTGKDKYHKYIKDNYGKFKDAHAINWQQLQNFGLYSYCLSGKADEDIKADILDSLSNYGKSILTAAENSAYDVCLNDYEYYWGSNAVVLNYAVDMLFLYRLFNEEVYLKAALNQLHYILGRNALSTSFVSGYGENPAGAFYHNWFNSAGGNVLYPRGFLVGGPNKDNFRVSSFPAKCYKPVKSDFTINEPAINYNAPLVFIAAFFSEKQ